MAGEPTLRHRAVVARDADVPADMMCRICLGNDNGSGLDRLFRPCRCKGTMAYVHARCLDQWRRTSSNAKSKHSCDQCNYEYNIASQASFDLVRLLSSPLCTTLMSIWAVFFLIYVIGVSIRAYNGENKVVGFFEGAVVLDDYVDAADSAQDTATLNAAVSVGGADATAATIAASTSTLEGTDATVDVVYTVEGGDSPALSLNAEPGGIEGLFFAVLWDMCDGAIVVGFCSFICTCGSYAFGFNGGGPGVFRGAWTDPAAGGGNKDCCKVLLIMIIVAGLYFAISFAHEHMQSLVEHVAGQAATTVLDIRDGQEVEREPRGLAYRAKRAAAVLAVGFIALTTAVLAITLLAVVWTRL